MRGRLIKRVLRTNRYIPWYIEGEIELFETLEDLKNYYNISKVKKYNKSWAIYKGKTYEWHEYLVV